MVPALMAAIVDGFNDDDDEDIMLKVWTGEAWDESERQLMGNKGMKEGDGDDEMASRELFWSRKGDSSKRSELRLVTAVPCIA